MSWHWSERQAQGFALGAAAREDRGARKAELGLAARSAGPALAVARELAALDRSARRLRLKQLLTERVAPQKDALERVPRALGLLAADVPRELGRRWLAQSPAPRPGYQPDPRLLTVLRALARGAEG